MTVRMSMLFSMGRGGGTESFYSSLSVASALTAGKALAAKRSLTMTPYATIFDVVVRDLDNPRVSAVTDASWFETGKRPAPETPDVKNAAAMIRMTAGTHMAKPWLHYLPDDFIQGATSGNAFLTATAVGLIDAYLAFLLGQNTWQLRGLSQALTVPPALHVASITNVAGVTTFTVPGATYVAGDKVILSGAKGARANQFNGNWKVVSNTAGALVVSSNARIDPNYFYDGNSALIRLRGYSYPAITAAQTIKAGTKKLGRVPNVPPGRRSARR